ncbi:MAG TPA: capsule assembly Wzi family protein [Candidatus Deferrimicrobiaceae bacterium]
MKTHSIHAGAVADRGRMLVAAIALLAGGLATPPAARAAELSIAREPEIYQAVEKLDAAGYLPGFAASTRPYPLSSVRDAVDNALASGDLPSDGFDRKLADWLAWYLAPRSEGRAGAGFSLTDRPGAPPLADGVPVPHGGSLFASGAFRAEPAAWFSAQASGAAFLADGDARGTRLLDTSVEAGWPFLSVEAGKISTWYGPGRNGALIFTNNAAPYPGVRLHNARPIAMPGLLSFLGTFRYDLFVARLEDDRPVPHPLLSGVRLSIRPSRYLEIGASRAMQYGGRGEPSGPSAWWTAFKGTHDNEPGSTGNQESGFDVAVNLPFRLQPVRLYLEAAGEDEATIKELNHLPVPSKWAFLGGIFLPSVFGSSRADLRLEWAANHLSGNGPSWYVHGHHPESYRGRILGHPMGTDARQLDLTGHWYFLPSTYLELSLGSLRRYSPGGPQVESTVRTGAGLVGWLTENLRAEGRFGSERIRNAEGFGGEGRTDLSFSAMLAWRVADGGQ